VLISRASRKEFSVAPLILGIILAAPTQSRATLSSLQSGSTLDAQSIATLEEKAAKGDAKAQIRLGILYANGQGVTKDYSQAALWYRKAAEQNDAGAQVLLGILYDDGKGVPQDSAQATLWWRKAAEQGDAGAQGLLGGRYHHGDGVPQDYAQAVTWYRKAADQGDTTAQNKELQWRRPTLVQCTNKVKGYPRITLRRHYGGARPPSRMMLVHNSCLVSCTAKAKVFHGTPQKPISGLISPHRANWRSSRQKRSPNPAMMLPLTLPLQFYCRHRDALEGGSKHTLPNRIRNEECIVTKAAGSNAKRKTNRHYADLILHSGECDYRVCEQLQASNSGTSQPPLLRRRQTHHIA
jgi:hypothetical protein